MLVRLGRMTGLQDLPDVLAGSTELVIRNLGESTTQYSYSPLEPVLYTHCIGSCQKFESGSGSVSKGSLDTAWN